MIRSGMLPVQQQAAVAMGLLAESCGQHLPVHEGYTYVIRQIGGRLLKIGKATDPVVRLGDIQRMNGAHLELVSLSHDAQLERHLHDTHRLRRRHGEWFELVRDPAPYKDGQCMGCRRTVKVAPAVPINEAQALADLVVPVVPFAIEIVEWGTLEGIWHQRGTSPADRSYVTHGGGRDGAYVIATQPDQRQAVIDLALLSAERTGGGWWMHEDPTFRAARDRLRDHVSNQTKFYWPGMQDVRAANWNEAIPQIQKNINELADMAVLVRMLERRAG